MKLSGLDELERGVEAFLRDRLDGCAMAREHSENTPRRVTAALAAMTSGHSQDPAEILGSALFPETCDEMIHVSGIVVNSLCVHHLLPFIGRAHVAYIPGENPKQSGRHVCVGLSKIPRMVTALARRLQTQERLTEEIVDVFYDTVKPAGVAVHIVAFHCCMSVRGAFEHMANTQTTAMRGCMRQGEARAEFLSSLDRSPLVLL